jgi:hypothetical protein
MLSRTVFPRLRYWMDGLVRLRYQSVPWASGFRIEKLPRARNSGVANGVSRDGGEAGVSSGVQGLAARASPTTWSTMPSMAHDAQGCVARGKQQHDWNVQSTSR